MSRRASGAVDRSDAPGASLPVLMTCVRDSCYNVLDDTAENIGTVAVVFVPPAPGSLQYQCAHTLVRICAFGFFVPSILATLAAFLFVLVGENDASCRCKQRLGIRALPPYLGHGRSAQAEVGAAARRGNPFGDGPAHPLPHARH